VLVTVQKSRYNSKTVTPTAKVYIIDRYKSGYSASYSEDPMSLSSDIAEICVPYIFKILWLYVKLRDESGKARL